MPIVLIFLLLFVYCKSNPSSNDNSQPFNRNTAIGSWYKYKDVYSWDIIGESSGTESMLMDDTADIFTITQDFIVRGFLDESSCYKHWKVPFSLSGDILTDIYFTGETTEDGFTYRWKTSLRKDGQYLVFTMTEDEDGFGTEKSEEYYAPYNSTIYPATWPKDTCVGVEYFFQ